MKKLIYLVIAIAILGLIVPGCIPVVPPAEQSESSSLTKQGPYTWYVDGVLGTDDGSHGTGIGVSAFKTIQYAINDSRVQNGDTIIVATATYTEQLTINKSITLQAGSMPTIDLSGFTGDGIKVTANNVTIEDFEIIGIPYLGSGSSNVNPTIAAEANYVTVQNCVFNTSGGALGKEAMVARPGTNNISFLNNEVNNYMFGITARGSSWGGSATLPDDGVTDMIVSGNTFNVGYVDTGSQITGEAVQIHYGDNIVVTDNTINGPGKFETCPYSLINSIGIVDFMSGYGAAGTVNYSNNVVTNCYVGIGTFAGNGQISGNTVTGNNIGIQVGQNDAVYISTPAEGVAITCNYIEYNIRGIWAQNFVPDGLVAHFNNIVGNTEYGVMNEDLEDDVFDATYNWWGHATGPCHVSTNSGGLGDEVSDNVDYNPWSFTPDPCEAKTLGFWKNHEDAVTEIWNLNGPLKLGNYPVVGSSEVIDMLKSAKANNAYKMLAAQLLAAKLNKLHLVHLGFVAGCFDDPIDNADAFLTAKNYSGPGMTKPSKVDKVTAIGLKNALDWVNINGCDECVCEWD